MVCFAWVKFRTADDAVKEKVLKVANVGSGHVKSNISAKLVALIKDKIFEVQALCSVPSMSACASCSVRRSKSLLKKKLSDRLVVQHFEVLV